MGLYLHQHVLPLLLRQSRLENRDLICLRMGNAELRRFTVKKIGGDRVNRLAKAVELAPGQRLDGARLLFRGTGFEQAHIRLARLLRPDIGDRRIDRRRTRRRERGWRRRCRGQIDAARAAHVAFRHAMIGAIEIVELRARRRRRRQQRAEP